MKSLLIGLLLVNSTTSFAGNLKNKLTEEALALNLDSTAQIEIVSSSPRIESKTIRLQSLRANKSEINLFAGNTYVWEEVYSADMEDNVENKIATFIFPIINIPRILGTAYDIVCLPVKASIKISQNETYKEDMDLLRKAIVSENTIEVSDARFDRIVNLLK
ncbi:MAG: hypothetical protein ACOYL6_14765 [Bacteriovoracaceae bacterium]